MATQERLRQELQLSGQLLFTVRHEAPLTWTAEQVGAFSKTYRGPHCSLFLEAQSQPRSVTAACRRH